MKVIRKDGRRQVGFGCNLSDVRDTTYDTPLPVFYDRKPALDRRATFENWVRSQRMSVTTLDQHAPAYPIGTYADSRVHNAWLAWQGAFDLLLGVGK